MIKKPIDLREVARRVQTGHYTSVADMEADLLLMMDNAKRYNDPKSLIYKDAHKMRALIRETGKELGALAKASKPYASSKTREKKLKLIEEIAGLETSDETLKRIAVTNTGGAGAQAAASVTSSVQAAQPVSKRELDDTHEADADAENSDEDEDEDESDDENNKSGLFLICPS